MRSEHIWEKGDTKEGFLLIGQLPVLCSVSPADQPLLWREQDESFLPHPLFPFHVVAVRTSHRFGYGVYTLGHSICIFGLGACTLGCGLAKGCMLLATKLALLPAGVTPLNCVCAHTGHCAH